MTNSTQALDYEIFQSDLSGDFLVWIPDKNGGVIGIGKTREEAIRDAIACLGEIIVSLGKMLA